MSQIFFINKSTVNRLMPFDELSNFHFSKYIFFVSSYFTFVATPISAKNMLNVEQSQQRKMALGDIKNGPIACEKSPVKNQRKLTFDDMKSGPSAFGKSPIKMDDANITTDKSIESEKASSKYVDYNDVWCNNLALSDADITRWINMLNAARTMPMTPPSPPKFIPFDDEDQEIPCKYCVFFI